MLHRKPEGQEYVGMQWYEPKHPARWCKLKYLWTVLKTGNMYGPYGEIWSFGPYDWTCYIRWRGMPGSFHPYPTWYDETKKTWRDWWRWNRGERDDYRPANQCGGHLRDDVSWGGGGHGQRQLDIGLGAGRN